MPASFVMQQKYGRFLEIVFCVFFVLHVIKLIHKELFQFILYIKLYYKCFKGENRVKHLIACGDTLELIKQVEPISIDLLVTSPPYWAKRVYNGTGEIGSEETPEAYVSRLADFFDELRPYLKPTANIFINIGDTYFGSGAGAWSKYLDSEGNIT